MESGVEVGVLEGSVLGPTMANGTSEICWSGGGGGAPPGQPPAVGRAGPKGRGFLL